MRLKAHTPILCVRCHTRPPSSKNGTLEGDGLRALALGEDGTVLFAGSWCFGCGLKLALKVGDLGSARQPKALLWVKRL